MVGKVIPDEAVEAATAALLKAWGYATTSDSGTSADIRIALEAAAPHIMAQGWDEGYRGCYERYMYEPVPPNPYRTN